MENYKKIAAPAESRVELHDALGLTGAEVSINRMAAGTQVPFVHIHKQNEEIYGFLAGRGTMTIDGEPVAVAEGDWMRVAPAAKRQLAAAADSDLAYICIQVREGSLQQMTATDAVI